MTPSGKRGPRVSVLHPEAETEFVRLWTKTPIPPCDIAGRLATRFEIEITTRHLENHANRLGLRRFISAGAFVSVATREERLNTASLDRERGGTTDNRRIHGPRYPVPAGGYRTRATIGE